MVQADHLHRLDRNDAYPLDSVRRVGRDVLRRELVAELTARTTSALFLYVNDAVVGLPGITESC